MDKDQLIEALEKALGDADLSSVAAAALDAVRNATTIAISHDVETGSIERRSILGTYLLRQRRLKMTGGRVEGFDETIASLKKRECLLFTDQDMCNLRLYWSYPSTKKKF